MKDYQEVGQAKVFSIARASYNGTLVGTVGKVGKDKISVSFPVDMQNGVRGVTANFLKSQFVMEPSEGLRVAVRDGLLRHAPVSKNGRTK